MLVSDGPDFIQELLDVCCLGSYQRLPSQVQHDPVLVMEWIVTLPSGLRPIKTLLKMVISSCHLVFSTLTPWLGTTMLKPSQSSPSCLVLSRMTMTTRRTISELWQCTT